MKRKILSLLLIVVFVFTLTACFEPIEKIGSYASTNAYEQAIINSAETIKKVTVDIESASINSKNVLERKKGSAVIFDVETVFNTNTYYAITSSALIGSVSTDVKSNGKSTSVTGYRISKEYDFAIIAFKTNISFDVAKIKSEDDKSFSSKTGETIVTIGTTVSYDNPNAFKSGVVTNDSYIYNSNQTDYFTHDAATNFGEIGSGVFDLNGNLVGINIEKILTTTLKEGNENVLGHNIALKTNRILKAILNIDYKNLDNSEIKSNEFLTSLDNIEYKPFDYESNVNEVFNNNKNKIVSILNGNETYTGLIIGKESYAVVGSIIRYQVLTASFDEAFTIEIFNSLGNVEASLIEIKEVNKDVSIIEFSSFVNLEVYSSKTINNSTEIDVVKGQSIVGITRNDIYGTSGIALGTLSKDNYQNNTHFMSDIKINFGKKGTPIFNLNNELIGIYSGKVDEILTSDGQLPGEGLSFISNINSFIFEIYKNLEKFADKLSYSPKSEYEKDLINVVNNVDKYTVTVNTGSGHGSGVIVKKEELKNNEYQYYVLTNHHVIEGSTDITLMFNDDSKTTIAAKDFTTSESHDMGIVRFVSEKSFEVAKSVFSDSNYKLEPVVGQKIISVGTPESMDKNGYITPGVIGMEPRGYRYSNSSNTVSNLGILQDTAINPGNSGGPAFDLTGRLIGINASKSVSLNSSEGLKISERTGYSLNANVLHNEFLKFREFNYKKLVRLPKLGVTIGQIEYVIVEEQYSKYYSAGDLGFVVLDFDYSREGHKYFEVNDLLYEINGIKIHSLEDVSKVITLGDFGDTYIFKVLRLNENNILEEILVTAPLS